MTDDIRYRSTPPGWAKPGCLMDDTGHQIGTGEGLAMTDEELGRAWAAKHKKRPSLFADGKSKWVLYWGDHFDLSSYADVLPMVLRPVARDDGNHNRLYPTESAAYTALGAELRRVLAFAESVKEVLGCD